MQNVSDLAKTRRFTPPLDLPTSKFVRVDEIDTTIPFSPYDSLEISTSGFDAATTSLEIEVIEVPGEAPPCERSLVDTTPFDRLSEPYERITIQPIDGPSHPHLWRPLLVIAVLAGAFVGGIGAGFALI